MQITKLLSLAVVAMALTLSAPAAQASGDAVSIIEEARDGENEPQQCPPGSLDQLVLCIVWDTVYNNTVVRAVVAHVELHYDAVSDFRNETVDAVVTVTWDSYDYTWAVVYASTVYVSETNGNELAFERAVLAAANEAVAYGADTAEGECYFLFGAACVKASTDGDADRESLLDGNANANPNCPGIVGVIRCHYTNVTMDTLDQGVNSANDVYGASNNFLNAQIGDSNTYVGAVNSATREYGEDAGDAADAAADAATTFAVRECKLVYSGCPLGMVELVLDDAVRPLVLA